MMHTRSDQLKNTTTMEARRPPQLSHDSERDPITNAALIMGAMDMLRDRNISAAFRERLRRIAIEAMGRLAVIAQEDARFGALKDQLAAALESTQVETAATEAAISADERKAA